ncbi:MAG: AAA family ATPase [Planctomycetota bacterium]
MHLRKVEIEGYRSIRNKVVLHVEKDVTILLGANDHGKSNLLAAIAHLNADLPFDADRDLNWDLQAKAIELPKVAFELELSPDERELLAAEENNRTLATANATDAATGDFIVPRLEGSQMPTTVTLTRTGVGRALTWPRGEVVPPESFEKVLKPLLPRVEVIKPWERVTDDATAAELNAESHAFMRGIFYYAGIDAKNSESLFGQTDANEMALRRASAELNETLKKSWTQGQNLEFVLRHESKSSSIGLRLQDPAVKERLVRASQRSSGFTHYFAMKTILHARQKEHPASSYILLFDEPGIYLHPAGQRDLINVLELLGAKNQVLYVTHSIFMINKTFPTRHRLIIKDEGGTRLDGKPYVSRWGPVIEAFGLSFTGTFLFANQVLLVEGDSDPILIYGIMQKLISMSKLLVDLNSFSAMATSDSRNTDVLLRVHLESATKPSIAVLVDGDPGGKERLAALQPMLTNMKIEGKVLAEGTEVEDHLIAVRTLYVKAAALYAAKLKVALGGVAPDDAAMLKGFTESFEKKFGSTGETAGVCDWVESAFKEIAQIKSPPSKVGIAREYVQLLDELLAGSIRPEDCERAIALCDWIARALSLSPPATVETRVLAKSGE